MTDISTTLEEKQKIYGDYSEAANISQEIKTVMRTSIRWDRLTPQQCESLEMIANRIGRILSGDQNHYDSWHGIAGFAELIAREINSHTSMQN